MKNPNPSLIGLGFSYCVWLMVWLDLTDVYSLKSLFAILHLKGDLITLIEGFVTVTVDACKVDKDIFSIRPLNKAITL